MCTKPILLSKIPKTALALLVFSLLYTFSALSPSVAAFADRYIFLPIRSLAAFFTNLLPFSLFEAGIISFFAIVVAILYRRYLLSCPRQLSEIAATIFVVVFIAYTVTLGIPTAVVRSYTSTEAFSDNDVIYAVHRLAEDLNLDFPTEKISVSEIYPTLLCDVRKYAREELGVKFAIIPRAKASLISAVLGRMGTQAYYCFFSGETVYDPEMPLPLAIHRHIWVG